MKWPTVEDATRRINILIGDQAETDMAARDLIVLMRELGRVTAENAALRQRADEATRNENIGCAALVERLLQRAYPMDSAYEPIVAAIRARIARCCGSAIGFSLHSPPSRLGARAAHAPPGFARGRGGGGAGPGSVGRGRLAV